jgi:hypothetical protein
MNLSSAFKIFISYFLCTPHINTELTDNGFRTRRVSVLTSASIEFGVIPHDHWFQPDWIDEDKAKAGRDKMVADGVIYGGMYRVAFVILIIC